MTEWIRDYRQQVAFIWDSLARLPAREVSLLLIFWAGPGGGKTTFLNVLREKCPREETPLVGLWAVRNASADTLAQEILTAVEETDEGKKILLLDDLDALLHRDDGEPFFTLEREAIYPLIERGDTLIVATSRVPLIQWREYDVRVRAENIAIPPLTREETAAWAQARKMDPAGVYAISLGHPQVLAWLQEQPGLPPEEIDRRVTERFLEGLSPDARQTAMAASLFPAFDLASLREALSAGEDRESFYSQYVERIHELIRAGLVFWDGEIGAYRFREGVVRRLLARAFLHQQPDEFRRIHRMAAVYYQQEALRAAYLHRTLVSALYHTAQAHRDEAPGTACLQWVRETLKQWMGADWDSVLRTWQTGAGDPATREELEELLGPAAMEQITHLLESATWAEPALMEQAKEVQR